MITAMIDVDGVLLDWDTGLKQYFHDIGFKIPTDWWARLVHREEYLTHFNLSLRQHGVYVDAYCRSLYMGNLQANHDAIKGVQAMKNAGWKLIVCTMLGTNKLQMKARVENLERVFGPVFEAIHFVDYRDLEKDPSGATVAETKASLMRRLYGNRIDMVIDDSAAIMDQFAEEFKDEPVVRVLFHNRHDMRGERKCAYMTKISSLLELMS